MVYSLTYRRPERAGSIRSDMSREEKAKSIRESIDSCNSAMSHGIPEALSFDRIIAGGACPPCTVRDFMNFLKYIELSAENLQFFLWFRNYSKRFDQLPENQKALSPEWTNERSAGGAKPKASERKTDHQVTILSGADFAASQTEKSTNPFFTPPHTPTTESHNSYEDSMTTVRVNHTERADDAFEDAGLKWKPLTVQPYREEVNRIISIYIADGGSRQLNLSSKERAALLHALQNTTHPTAFRDVLITVEWSLRRQAHPNFIRWVICNGNGPRVVFARTLGIGGVVGGIVSGVVLTLSSAGRGWRALSLIGFVIGIATLIAAWKGMCIVLHGMHHRHLRPWELFRDEDEMEEHGDKLDSVESLSSQGSSNSWEDEPWVVNYEKRSFLRRIFDREVWVQEPALRQIQDTIFVQAIGGSLVLSGVCVGILCALPKGNYF